MKSILPAYPVVLHTRNLGSKPQNAICRGQKWDVTNSRKGYNGLTLYCSAIALFENSQAGRRRDTRPATQRATAHRARQFKRKFV
jgi:hypothetical protein